MSAPDKTTSPISIVEHSRTVKGFKMCIEFSLHFTLLQVKGDAFITTQNWVTIFLRLLLSLLIDFIQFIWFYSLTIF